MKEFESSRRFRLADYDMSHSQLLIRSPKNEKDDQNIDLIFQDVTHLDVDETFYGIRLTLAEGEEKPAPGKKITVIIESQGIASMIDCLNVIICSNDLELKESSLGVIQHKGRDNVLGVIE